MTHVNPSLDQDSFRGRNDDGSESAATWKASVNTDWSQGVDENFRVRFLIQEENGGAENNFAPRLQYNRNAAGWNDVTDISSVVRASASANFADDDSTTQQIGSGTFISPNSGMDEDNGLAGENNDIDFAGNDEVEVEYCCQIIGADVANNDTIQLRVVRDGGSLDSWTNTPSVTASKTASFAYTGSGGLVTGGAAALAVGWDIASVGGLTTGGAATTAFSPNTNTFAYTGSGGLSAGGAAAVAQHPAVVGAGGLAIGGAAILAAHLKRTGAGGLSLAGAADLARHRQPVGAGGLSLGGEAATAGPSEGEATTAGAIIVSIERRRRRY